MVADQASIDETKRLAGTDELGQYDAIIHTAGAFLGMDRFAGHLASRWYSFSIGLGHGR